MTGKAFAAKRLSPRHILDQPCLLDNELDGLMHAKLHNIPRVPELVDMVCCSDGESALILE